MNLQYGGENIFFSDLNFKNDNPSKKTFLLYCLTKNTTYVEQFFFLKIPNGGLIKMAIFFHQFFEMLIYVQFLKTDKTKFNQSKEI
jgi:hypothetical protein